MLKFEKLAVLPLKICTRKGSVCFKKFPDYQQNMTNDVFVQRLVLEFVLPQSGVAADWTSWRVKRLGSLMVLIPASEQ